MWGSKQREARRISRAMVASRRRGQCVYEADWTLTGDDDTEDAYSTVVTWCRQVLGAARRPWGIDGFDLAASRLVRGGDPESLSLRGLTPRDLYDEAGVPALHRFLSAHRSEPQRLAVALFSWGDAAHLALD